MKKKKKIICEMKIFIIFATLLCHTAQACKITSDNDFGNFNHYNPHHCLSWCGFLDKDTHRYIEIQPKS